MPIRFSNWFWKNFLTGWKMWIHWNAYNETFLLLRSQFFKQKIRNNTTNAKSRKHIVNKIYRVYRVFKNHVVIGCHQIFGYPDKISFNFLVPHYDCRYNKNNDDRRRCKSFGWWSNGSRQINNAAMCISATTDENKIEVFIFPLPSVIWNKMPSTCGSKIPKSFMYTNCPNTKRITETNTVWINIFLESFILPLYTKLVSSWFVW